MSSVADITPRDASNIKGFFNGNRSHLNATKAVEMANEYSPIVLNTAWSPIWRLGFLVIISIFGTMLNSFFIGSFFIDKKLRRKGNIFLICTGFADLVLTFGVIPISTVVLMSNRTLESITLCHSFQVVTQSSSYAYNLFYMLYAFQLYFKWISSNRNYNKYLSLPLVKTIIFVIVFCISISCVGVHFNLNYDYCRRQHYGNSRFRVSSFLILHAIPFTIIIALSCCFLPFLKNKTRSRVSRRHYYAWIEEYQLTKLIFLNYALFVVAWIPYIIVVCAYPDTSDSLYYICAWIGVIRPIFSYVMLFLGNVAFRKSYSHIFYYCLCKKISKKACLKNNDKNYYKFGAGNYEFHVRHKLDSPVEPQNGRPVQDTHSIRLQAYARSAMGRWTCESNTTYNCGPINNNKHRLPSFMFQPILKLPSGPWPGNDEITEV